MKVFILLLLLAGCSTFKQPDLGTMLSSAGYQIVIGCNLHDLNGNIIRSYPGTDCFYENDGSLLIYDGEKFELSRFDKDMKKLWSIKKHFHHNIKKMSSGNYLLNSSEFKRFGKYKKVRFDQVLELSTDGKIIKKFSFYDYFLNLPGANFIRPDKTSWDKSLGTFLENTHLASSYEIPFDIKRDGKVLYPKGSIIVTMNGNLQGVRILNSSFTKILDHIRLAHRSTLHDGQFVSSSRLMFMKNTTYPHPISMAEQASIKFYDVFEKRIKEEIHLDLYALYTGGAQLIDNEILFITDSNSGQKVTESNFIETNPYDYQIKSKIHETMKGRVVIYQLKTKQIEQIHFDYNFQHAKLEKLDSFLKLNKGI